MAWTQDDIELLKCAILKKASGQRLTAAEFKDRMEQYADASLKDLRDLLDEMQEEVATSARRARVFRTRHARGL